MNPIDFFRNEFDKAKDELILRVHIELLQENARLILSRLMTLDPKNAAAYQGCIKEIP